MPMHCCNEGWKKIPENEPVFILRGKDNLAARTVRFWLAEAAASGVNSDKLARVVDHIRWLEEFAENNPEKMHLPD